MGKRLSKIYTRTGDDAPVPPAPLVIVDGILRQLARENGGRHRVDEGVQRRRNHYDPLYGNGVVAAVSEWHASENPPTLSVAAGSRNCTS